MIDSINIMQTLYDVLNAGGVRSIISGGIYHQGQRPINSNREDIVLNVLSLTTESYPQHAIANVNIFVPDIDVKVGKNVTKVADEQRLHELVKEVESVIRDAVVPDMDIYPTEQYLLNEDLINQHYYNVRVSIINQ